MKWIRDNSTIIIIILSLLTIFVNILIAWGTGNNKIAGTLICFFIFGVILLIMQLFLSRIKYFNELNSIVRLFIFLLILIVIVIILFSVSYPIHSFCCNLPTYTPTPTLTQTITPTPTYTITSTLTPTYTQTSTETLTLTPTPYPDMVLIPKGNFIMGNDDSSLGYVQMPQHVVYLDNYLINAHEITNIQYIKCIDVGVCTPPQKATSYNNRNYFGNDAFNNYPVIWITYNQAEKFCEWIRGHLPTEEEWEKAGRGPEGWTYPWGISPPTNGDANLAFISGISDTASIGFFSKDRSQYGVYDMSGNVSEWTYDWFTSYKGSSFPFNNDGSLRSIRGGNFLSIAYASAMLFMRYGGSFDAAYATVGFRCVVK
jgi:formylglycine-generating enzyme required for sulfatase activity